MKNRALFLGIAIILALANAYVDALQPASGAECVDSNTMICDANEEGVSDEYDIKSIEFVKNGINIDVEIEFYKDASGLISGSPLFLYFADEPGSATRLVRIYHDHFTRAYASTTELGLYVDAYSSTPEINSNTYKLHLPVEFVTAASGNYAYIWAYWMYSKDRAPDSSYFYYQMPGGEECEDTDNGQSYYNYGSVYTQGNSEPSVIDTCSGNYLNEGICASDGGAKSSRFSCPYGCEEGACMCPGPYHVLGSDGRCVWSCSSGTTPDLASGDCVCKEGYLESGLDQFDRMTCLPKESDPGTSASSSPCRDSDYGKNFAAKGIVTVEPDITFPDACASDKILNEYYCQNGNAYSTANTCSGQCVDGACVEVRGDVDLVITNVSYMPEEPRAGQIITFNVSVKNIGSDDISGQEIRLSNGGSIDALMAGETRVIIDKLGLTTPGYNNGNLMVNAGRSITETNYENNDYNINIFIKPTFEGDGEHTLKHWESLSLDNGLILKLDGTNVFDMKPYSVFFRVYDSSNELIGATPSLTAGDIYSGNGFEVRLGDIQVFSPGNANFQLTADYISRDYIATNKVLPDLVIEDIEYKNGKIGVKYCNREEAISSKVIYIKMEAGNTIISGFGSKSVSPLHVPDPGQCLYFDGYDAKLFNLGPNGEVEVKTVIDSENYLAEEDEDNNRFSKSISLGSGMSHPVIVENSGKLNSLRERYSHLSEESRQRLDDFLEYGIDGNSRALGAGERAAVVESYRLAFGKYPENENEMNDVAKIANGRWPEQRDEAAEARAREQFMRIYKRIPDTADENDNAAVVVMAYGLRQQAENRSLVSEAHGIEIFSRLFGSTPQNTEDWNAMQAITYSGARRMPDSDGDLLPDRRENELGTDVFNIDSDSDGYNDGIEVLNGYDPLGAGKK